MQPYQTPETTADSAQNADSGVEQDSMPQVFVVKTNTQLWAILLLLGGLFMLLVAVAGFLVQLFVIDGDVLSLTLTTTLPTLVAVGLITTAVRMLKSPKAIELTELGVQQHPGKLILWSDIAVTLFGEEYPASKSLHLLDAKGKTLAKLTDSIENSDQLFGQVQKRVKHGSDQVLAERIRLKKARKTALMCFVGSMILAAISVFLLFSTYESQQKRQRLETAGAEGEAIIREKFLAPDGRTTRIRFSFGPGKDGSEVHNVEVEKNLYPSLEEGESIAVRYDPEDRGNVELLEGQVDSNNMTASKEYLLAGGALLFSPFLFALGVMLWKGLELKADQKGIRLVRLGDE